MPKVLVLGDGKLGSEIVKQTHWPSISRKYNNFDFCNLASYAGYLKTYDCILNCIANTDTYSPNREEHWNVNYKAVADLSDYCEAFHKKIVHISTDFIFANSSKPATEETIPVHANNWYSYCKLLSDGHIQMRNSNYLLIRGSFKPVPFPYEKAFTNVTGNFLYTDVFASLVIQLIKKGASGVFNVGSSEPHTIYDLAVQTNRDVKPIIESIDPSMPENVEMNTSKMYEFLGIEP
jgi:dTDP-4-dehydrorhamnose reductase